MILRLATHADEKMLLDWRNDEDVCAMSTSTGYIEMAIHKKWMQRMIGGIDGCAVFIAEVDGVPVGKGQMERAFSSLSPKMDKCLIGYSISREHRRKGYGSMLAKLLVEETKRRGYVNIAARIRRGNMCSVKVAIAAGVNMIELF